MNQKEATVSTILAVLEERGVSYEENGEAIVGDVLTDKDRAQVRDALFTMFRNGDVTYKVEFQAAVDDDSELKKYISGLVNNWIRKYKGFNAGQAYKAKNPGSRAHSRDEQLTELKKLSALCADDPDALADITEAIVARKAVIASEKAKDVVINADALPDHLKHLVS